MKNARNIIFTLAAFGITFAISFFLSPYIVRTLGVEANGLINLNRNFLDYASILTITLSSMTSRFVTVELRRDNHQAATEYYTSSYIGNLLGAAALLPVMTLTVINFSTWLNVPSRLATDAAILATLYFTNFLLTLVFPLWQIGTWATNNLHLESLRTMQSVLLRGGMILLLFLLLEPNVVYVGVATLTSGVFALAFSGYYKRHLLPDLHIRRSAFRWGRLLDLLGGGFWNSINYLGNLLSTGFHLLLTNLFLGATAMGYLSLAMTVPSMANQLSVMLGKVFQPSLAFAFAAGDFTAIARQVKRAVNITSFLVTMPIAALAVYGHSFFSLWVPGQDADHLYALSIGVAVGLFGITVSSPLQNVFIITNSQRRHSTASAAMGAANICLALILLLFTDLGVWAILMAAAISVTIRLLLFTVPMAARECQTQTPQFYIELFRALGYLAILCAVGLGLSTMISTTTWIGFFGSAAIMCVIGAALNLFLLTSRVDRDLVFRGVRRLLS